jgi:phospholipid/cholesterol/gamma-HCH transport system substrate-binding protein
MESKREQAMVGLFVVVATALLLATLFSLSGTFTKGNVRFKTFFKFAGGLQPGSPVSYAGVKVGRVEELRISEQRPSEIEVEFTVQPHVPVKTDSLARILSLSALGENQLEVVPGTQDAPRAKAGAVLPSREPFGIAQLADKLEALGPETEKLLKQLNERVAELQVTIARVNDLINDQNRANVSASIADVRGMLAENRPVVKKTLSNVDATAAKFPALVDDLKKTIADAKTAINNIDSVIGENRQDVRKSVEEMRRTLVAAESAASQMDRLLNYNAENIDEILENIRMTTENLKLFTDQIRQRPASLIRSSGPPDRKPGTPPKD